MPRPTRCNGWLLCAALLAGVGRGYAEDLPRYVPSPEELKAAYAQRPDRAGPRVYKERIAPNWLADDARFWYRNDLKGGAREFVLVDCEAGTRGPAFDHGRLAEALSKAAGKEYAADRLLFDQIEFADGGKTLRFRVGDAAWACSLDGYECTRDTAAAGVVQLAPDANRAEPPRRPRRSSEPGRPSRSPDGKWTASIRDGNLFVRDADGKETQLTTDGRPGAEYGLPNWSPDSKALAAFRISPGDDKEVFLVESSPRGGGRAVLHRRPYPLPGDKFTSYELHLFDPAAGTGVKADAEPVDLGFPRLRWAADGSTLTYEKVDRGHQRFRLIRVDAKTGAAKNLIDETADTFIWTAHTETVGIPPVTWLERSNELIYTTEKNGWRHLYLIDAEMGAEKNPITKGEWVVRGVDRIDEENRQVWFRASGMNPDQDPYFVHHYRVNFDGTGLTALTAGDGTHTVQYSPGRKYLIDTRSRVDRPPVHELRRVSDGSRVCELEKADISELTETGWRPPEVFTAKGRDGTTDIWGIICRPANFDPAKKYPVIESIYAGPQGSFTPKAFSPARQYRTLTDLGFAVVQMDGMGTANRSKAFHDVCWKNLKDAGFPDRIAWHKAAAAKYPWYDISRVGIYGTSAGGQNAAGAVLFHGDFYKAAVASCGCHDNRMDKASWNEQWMGYPVGPHYAACSNIDSAGRLTGKLMLILGEMDDNVPTESTVRLCGALIKAGKAFDFVLIPGLKHSNGGPYGTRRMRDFFVRHLHGADPPDANAAE